MLKTKPQLRIPNHRIIIIRSYRNIQWQKNQYFIIFKVFDIECKFTNPNIKADNHVVIQIGLLELLELLEEANHQFNKLFLFFCYTYE